MANVAHELGDALVDGAADFLPALGGIAFDFDGQRALGVEAAGHRPVAGDERRGVAVEHQHLGGLDVERQLQPLAGLDLIRA